MIWGKWEEISMKKEAILESKCILDQTEGSMVRAKFWYIRI